MNNINKALKFWTKILWQIKREFLAFFYSPIAYVALGVSMLINGGVFLFIVTMLQGPNAMPGAPLEFLFSTIFFWLVMLILIPLITMRSIAEERQSGTYETLVTAPVNDTQIVIAKYLSSLIFFIIMWIPVLTFPTMLGSAAQIDKGPLIGGFLGVASVGAMLIAVGIFCSTITKNQLVSSIVTFAMMMSLFLVGLLGDLSIFSDTRIFEYFNLYAHMEDFARGIIDTRRFVYYFSMAGLALFASVQVLNSRRWQG